MNSSRWVGISICLSDFNCKPRKMLAEEHRVVAGQYMCRDWILWPTLVLCLTPQLKRFDGPLSALAGVGRNKSLRQLRELLVTREIKALILLALVAGRRGSLCSNWGRGSTLTPCAPSQPVHSHIPRQKGDFEQA